MPDDHLPISAADARRLFAPLRNVRALVIAVSGGPDSVALMWLLARWRKALARGPRLVAVTVDHGLRPQAAAEARHVKRLARTLDLPHRTVRWSGAKPKAGLPAAARGARYRLLAEVARKVGASHIVTAHSQDDQAETLLMRLLRGSGLTGLAAMAASTERDGLVLARPLLTVPKAQLVATLNKAGIAFADDPSNRDPAFTRSRLRALLPQLAAEGGDARALARLAVRFARANAALEVLVDGAERYFAVTGCVKAASAPRARVIDARRFAALPEEVRVRLLLRAVNAFGHEGPAELGKVEALLAVIDRASREKVPATGPKSRQKTVKQTLAGALISLSDGRLRIEPAPLRKNRSARGRK